MSNPNRLPRLEDLPEYRGYPSDTAEPAPGAYEQPEQPTLQARRLMIAAMGAIGFRIEQGPNAHSPEKLHKTDLK